MYQLVKKKKRSVILKIIGFLVICALIKEVISFNTRPAPVSEQLDGFANSINKRCPLVVDSNTTLNNCIAVTGNGLHFNYQINTLNKEEIDTVSLMLVNRQEISNRIKTDPSMAFFKKNDLNFTASYYDKTGKYICGVVVTPADYKEK